MKVDDNLMVIRGQAVTGTGTRKARPITAQSSQPGVILLISQENQRAWRLKPNSLEEAKKILSKVKDHLQQTKGETLSDIHGLDSHCLIRLR